MSYKLQEIQVELAGICNATCCYCTWQLRTVGKQFMKKELAIRLLDEAKDMGVEVIRYHGLGESTMHPNLIEIIKHGEKLNHNHSMSTNCFILKGELANELKQIESLSIILAIPWVMKDKYVETCIENALNYLEGAKNARIHVQMVCQDTAEIHYRKFIDTFLLPVEQCANAYIHLKQPVTWPNDNPNKGFINRELEKHPKVIFDNRVTPVSIAQGCNMPERFLMILADGTPTFCCVGMDDCGLPSLNEKSLQETWESARMLEIRQLWRESSDKISCGTCKKRTDCLQ